MVVFMILFDIVLLIGATVLIVYSFSSGQG